jgi:sulfite exporter TauE/SafE
MHFPEGFMLGLSTGVVCLAYCGPVIIPYLMGEGNNVKKNTFSVGLFLGGRLVAYLLVGLFSGLLGTILIHHSPVRTRLFGIVYILLALFLIAYGFYRFKEVCLGEKQTMLQRDYGLRWPLLIPFAGGFATGLNLCPPFLLAITGAMEGEKISGSLLFFVAFFMGTSVYFIPLPFIGFFRRQYVLRIIGKFAALLAGLFYFYKGAVMVVL